MKKIFLSTLLITSIATAFTFDVWESKTTLDEAIQIAKSNNLPLYKDGSICINKEFNKRFLYLKKYPNNRVFRYSTTLLNKRASVILYFTKHSKELYSVKIRWVESSKDFTNTLYQMLDKKYGKREVVLTLNIGEFILYKIRQWRHTKKKRKEKKLKEKKKRKL